MAHDDNNTNSGFQLNEKGGVGMLKTLTRLALILGFITVVGLGCTKYASKKTLSDLDEARMAAEQAEAKANELQAQLTSLEQDLAAKQDKLAELQKKLDECLARQPKRK